jgi:hypothetical protein
MIKFLLGVVVGAAGMASYLKREKFVAGTRATGRVDELSSAAHTLVDDPPIHAGGGTPDRTRDIAIA